MFCYIILYSSTTDVDECFQWHFKTAIITCLETKMIFFKDARSVSLYPYNQSQILQNVKYTN